MITYILFSFGLGYKKFKRWSMFVYFYNEKVVVSICYCSGCSLFAQGERYSLMELHTALGISKA